MKILSNLPIEDLNKENDYLGIIEKGDMIVSLLKSEAVDLSEIKMFALYGNWGSGKSTLMKYMKKQFDASNDKFKTFYFDAWQYENGRDLSYSLLEFMVDKGLSSGEKRAGKILDIGAQVLIGIASSAALTIPYNQGSIRFFFKNLFKTKDKSFHGKIQKFKKEFRELENKILSTDSEKYNIVFIDDLDRCEPDKVLDLLSEIKLFFNYGEHTVFFFGVDEKAVKLAIKNKYRETIKSSEYLEKIFDVVFHIPTDYSLEKLLSQHFPETIITNFGSGVLLIKKLEEFFKQIRFTEPRRLKKLLNSYTLFSHIANIRENENTRTPLISEDNGSFLYSIVTIYLLILKSFYPSKFKSFSNLENKYSLYREALKNHQSLEGANAMDGDFYSNIFTQNNLYGSLYFSMIELKEEWETLKAMKSYHEKSVYGSFTIVFAPSNVTSLSRFSLSDFDAFLQLAVEEKQIDYYMLRYLIVNIIKGNYKIKDHDKSEISISNLVWRVENYL